MGVTLTKVEFPIAFILRGNGPEHAKYGDPYTWAAEIEDRGDGLAYISALRGEVRLNRDLINEIGNLLRDKGFKRVEWDRTISNDRRKRDRRKKERNQTFKRYGHDL
jgi:hypothetical protein